MTVFDLAVSKCLLCARNQIGLLPQHFELFEQETLWHIQIEWRHHCTYAIYPVSKYLPVKKTYDDLKTL